MKQQMSIFSNIYRNLFWLLALLLFSCEAPQNDFRTALTGTWNCREVQLNSSNNDNYKVDLSGSSVDEDMMLARNFYNLGQDVELIFSDNDITLPNQTIEGIELYGTGSLDKNYNRMVIFFTADKGDGYPDTYEAELTRVEASK